MFFLLLFLVDVAIGDGDCVVKFWDDCDDEKVLGDTNKFDFKSDDGAVIVHPDISGLMVSRGSLCQVSFEPRYQDAPYIVTTFTPSEELVSFCDKEKDIFYLNDNDRVALGRYT